MKIQKHLSVVALLAVVMVSASCSKSGRAWQNAKKANTIDAYSSYEQSYPDSLHASEAAEAIRTLEIGSLNDEVKAFLNGDKRNNRISTLNGIAFAEKDQNPSTGMTFFGTSSLRVSETLSNRQTGKSLSVIFQPKPNRMVESIESITADEGVTITFTNGHTIEYTQGRWKSND